MGLWADIKHIAGNMVGINKRYEEIRQRIIREIQIDISKLPEPHKTQIYNLIKSDYLEDGGKHPIDGLVNRINLFLIGSGVTGL